MKLRTIKNRRWDWASWRRPRIPAVQQNPKLCPTPQKKVLTREEAEQAVKSGSPHVNGRMWCYECKCGRWHLTTKLQ